MKRFPVAVVVLFLVGCGNAKLSSDSIGQDGKCTVQKFRPYGASQPALTAEQRATAIRIALVKAEAFTTFVFLISNPDKPVVLPGHPFMAQVKEGLDNGKCKATDDPWTPRKGEKKSEYSVRGDACPVEAYLILDERQGGFVGASKSKYHRLSKFNDKSLAKTDLLGMKFDGETEGDNVPTGDVYRTSICESFTGTLETKSLGNVPFYASSEERHVVPKDIDIKTFTEKSESHERLRRGFKFSGFVAEFEGLKDSAKGKSTYKIMLNGVPLSAEEVKLLGNDEGGAFGTLSAN